MDDLVQVAEGLAGGTMSITRALTSVGGSTNQNGGASGSGRRHDVAGHGGRLRKRGTGRSGDSPAALGWQ